MKISASNNLSQDNRYVYNTVKKYTKSSDVKDIVYFTSRSNKNTKEKNIVKNAISYITAFGVILSSIIGLAPKAGEKKEINTSFMPAIYVEEYSQENNIVESAEEILRSNPDVADAYDNIMQALNTYSEQLGEDALPLIKERVAEIGNGRVDVIDVLKILWIESNGRIYGDDNEILQSYSGAYGAFQITEDTEDYLNYYFGLEGTEDELNIENPYDNLDACIYTLRFLNDKRSEDIKQGVELPTGNNLKSAIAWSYHDGAWANEITDYGQDYIEKFEKLSRLDEFPQVIDYILSEQV